MAQGSSVEKWSQWDLLKLNSFSFGITGFILAMDTVVLPVIVLTVAPDEFKNTYLAILGISGLIMAAMVQPTIGRISDRTQSAFGRRVPFIISGAVFSAIGLVGIRLAPNFGVLFAVWIFIQVNVNIAYGPGLALIRDCVPLNRIGMASSMKIMSDAAGGAVMIAVTGALIGNTGSLDWEWISLGILAFLMILAISITSVQVSRRELKAPTDSQRTDIQSSFRSVMSAQLSLFLLSRLIMITAIASFQTYGLFFLRDSVGLDNPAEALGRMTLVIAGALAIGVHISGWMSDRVGRKPVVVVGATRVGLPFEHPSAARADRTSTTITRHVPHRTPSRNIGGFLPISVPIRSSGSLPRWPRRIGTMHRRLSRRSDGLSGLLTGYSSSPPPPSGVRRSCSWTWPSTPNTPASLPGSGRYLD